ncbi:MAG: hypothetical protein ACTSVM_04285 [Candidatus Ranarchaeia archaeon]
MQKTHSEGRIMGKKEKKIVLQKYCPNCGEASVQRQSSKTGGLLSHMGLTTPRYQCMNCGWVGYFYLEKKKGLDEDR